MFVSVLTIAIAVEDVEKGLLSWLGLAEQMPARMQNCVTVGEGRFPYHRKIGYCGFAEGLDDWHIAGLRCQYPDDRL